MTNKYYTPKRRPKIKKGNWKLGRHKRVDAQTFHLGGCIMLIGATVKRAIQDLITEDDSSAKVLAKADAKRFLFEPGVLEAYFYKYHLENNINCAMIRAEAIEIMEGRKELKDDTDFLETKDHD